MLLLNLIRHQRCIKRNKVAFNILVSMLHVRRKVRVSSSSDVCDLKPGSSSTKTRIIQEIAEVKTELDGV